MDEKERQQRIEASRAGRRAVEGGDSTSWFDPLYRAAREADAPGDVPWVDLRPNRFLVQWLDSDNPTPCRTCVIGSGLGEDAEELARRGFDVTAFDVAPTAVEWCRDRYPDTTVSYQVADLFDMPEAWLRSFDLVVEVYTVQALPLIERARSSAAVSSLVGPGSRLVVVCHGRPEEVIAPAGPPWPISRSELSMFAVEGMVEESIVEIDDPDGEGVMRFRATYRR